MNLTKNPSEELLRNLLASYDDDAGIHILWVDRSGKVHIALLEAYVSPAEWEGNMGQEIQFRYESYRRGNGYVGPEAANDSAYVSDLFRRLVRDWEEGARGFIDI